MNEGGRTLIEMIVGAGIVSVLAVATFRQVRAYSADAHLLGAAYVFKGEFRKAHSLATRGNVYTAIRFEDKAAIPRYSVYRDGNLNGVRKEDIAKGIDRRVAGPFFLDAQAAGVRVGITRAVELPWRFCAAGNRNVSRPWPPGLLGTGRSGRRRRRPA